MKLKKFGACEIIILLTKKIYNLKMKIERETCKKKRNFFDKISFLYNTIFLIL